MPDTPPIPDDCFLNTSGPVPLVVRHETGEPTHAVVGDELIPYAEWKATQAKPPAGPPRTMTIQSGDGAFAGTIEVS
jgi:hypothetical protein